MLSDYLWYYSTQLLFVILTGVALWLSQKKKHKIVFWLIIINFIYGLIDENYYANIPIYLYFLFLLGNWIYRKIFKKPLKSK